MSASTVFLRQVNGLEARGDSANREFQATLAATERQYAKSKRRQPRCPVIPSLASPSYPESRLFPPERLDWLGYSELSTTRSAAKHDLK